MKNRSMTCRAVLLPIFWWSTGVYAAEVQKADNTASLIEGSSWVDGITPGVADVVLFTDVFTQAGAVGTGGPLSVSGVRITTGTTLVNIDNTTAANFLELGASGLNMSLAERNLTIQSLRISAPQVWDIAAGRTFTTGATSLLSGSFSLQKSGEGTAILNGANTFSGGLTVAGGTLISSINSSGNALGSGAVTVNAGSTLRVNNLNTANISPSLVIPNSFSGEGLLQINFAAGTTARNTTIPNASAFTGTIRLSNSGLNSDKWSISTNLGTLPSSLNIDSGSQLFLLNAGVVSFTGGITVSGTGNNENRGAIRLGGTLNSNVSLAGNTTIGSESGTLNGSVSGGVTGSHTLTIGTSNSTGNATINGVLSDGAGTLALTKTQGGTLTLSGASSYSGITSLSGGTIALVGGNNRLPTTTTVAFSGTSTLNIGTTDQTLHAITSPANNSSFSNTITGSGTLTVNGNTLFSFGPGGALDGSRDTSLNMAGLARFVFDSPAQIFRVGLRSGTSNSASAVVGTTLVRAAQDTTITTLGLRIGDISANSNGGNSTLRLNGTNAIYADTINLGASGRSNATLNFDVGSVAPIVTIRATNGSSPVSSWEVGRVANFSANTWTATVDFGQGELDANVNVLRIGIANPVGQTNRAGIQQSFFTMGKGTLEVGTLVLGEQSGTGAAGSTFAGNGTFTLKHTDGLLLADSIQLAVNTGTVTGGTRSTSGTLNLEAGTLVAREIRLGDQTNTGVTVNRAVNWTSGIIKNPLTDNLTITDVPINLLAGGTRQFAATTGRTITIESDVVISGAGQGFEKIGLGTLSLAGTNTYSGNTDILEGTLLVNGAQVGGGLIVVHDDAVLGGVGNAGDVIVNNAGMIAPGLSAGTLTTMDLTLQPSARLAFELSAPNQGAFPSSSDFIHVQGALHLDGQLHLTALPGFGSPAIGDSWVLLAYDDLLSFTDLGLTIASKPAGIEFTIDTMSSPGQVLLTVVPEPSTALLFLLGLFCLHRHRLHRL